MGVLAPVASGEPAIRRAGRSPGASMAGRCDRGWAVTTCWIPDAGCWIKP